MLYLRKLLKQTDLFSKISKKKIIKTKKLRDLIFFHLINFL